MDIKSTISKHDTVIDTTREFLEQKTTWLELFYDLAYVAAIAQLTYILVSVEGSLFDHFQFIFLFVAVFLSWFGNVVYRNIRGEEDDNFDRWATLVQMFFALVMSVFLHEAFGPGAVGFVIGYVGTRLVLLVLLRHLNKLEGHRTPRTPHVLWGYRIAIIMWLISLFFPEPIRYAIWIAALSLELLVPFTTDIFSRKVLNNPQILNKHHLPERLGLFTILVMGESLIVVAVVNNISSGLISLSSGFIGSAVFLIMCGIWWLYFSHIERYARGKAFHLFRYVYAHIPILIGVMYLAAGTKIGMGDFASFLNPIILITLGLTTTVLGFNLLKISTGRKIITLFLPTVLFVILIGVELFFYKAQFEVLLLILTILFGLYILIESRACKIYK